MNSGAEAAACKIVANTAIRAIGWGPTVMANNGIYSPRHKENQVRDLSPFGALAKRNQRPLFCSISALWRVACLC